MNEYSGCHLTALQHRPLKYPSIWSSVKTYFETKHFETSLERLNRQSRQLLYFFFVIANALFYGKNGFVYTFIDVAFPNYVPTMKERDNLSYFSINFNKRPHGIFFFTRKDANIILVIFVVFFFCKD